MTPTASRLLRVVLRLIVLVQLASLALVAFTLYELVSYGSEVTPGAVLLTTAMLACTLVAFRATFRLGMATRGQRLVFMSAQAIVALLPLAGRATLVGIAAPDSLLPPNEVFGSEFVLGMMALELLFAACLAAVSALLAPVLLSPALPALGLLSPAHETAQASSGGSRVSRSLGLWVGSAVLATAAIYGTYAAHYRELQQPAARMQQLFAGDGVAEQLVAARHLIDANLADQPETRSELYAALNASSVVEQSWAAYVLIAARLDDGRAMTKLRAMAGTFAVTTAMQTFALLGAAATPALPEIARFLRQPTEDAMVANAQIHAADALAAIGPPAAAALPSLVEHARDVNFPELRFAAGRAVDQIDPEFAKRCATNAATMIEALGNTALGPLELRPECIPSGKPPAQAQKPKT